MWPSKDAEEKPFEFNIYSICSNIVGKRGELEYVFSISDGVSD